MSSEEPENELPPLPEDEGDKSGHSEGYYEAHTDAEPALPEPPQPEPVEKGYQEQDDAEVLKIVRKKTIRAFTWFGISIFLFIAGMIWLVRQPEKDGALKPFRKVLAFNERVNRQFFNENHRAPEYLPSKAVPSPRVNGDIGMDTDFNTADWVLNVVNIDKNDTITFSMEDIKKLPKTEIVFNFKCIEGWSEITRWSGVRFIDFIKYYKLGTHSGKTPDTYTPDDMAKYAGFETPDGAYYVGLDMPSAIHPQTLLCYEMNGKPLPYDQGAPLRLMVPVKYGIKSLKRIGLIFFSDKRPHDYWYEQGYDYDAAL
jgi:DMSO/TMAO reductase YedYZ molybdopterin-dependent catalytic subunit